jgi:hypothetical protein
MCGLKPPSHGSGRSQPGNRQLLKCSRAAQETEARDRTISYLTVRSSRQHARSVISITAVSLCRVLRPDPALLLPSGLTLLQHCEWAFFDPLTFHLAPDLPRRFLRQLIHFPALGLQGRRAVTGINGRDRGDHLRQDRAALPRVSRAPCDATKHQGPPKRTVNTLACCMSLLLFSRRHAAACPLGHRARGGACCVEQD